MGGAFVGAAPHLTYRYLLETLCNEGYIVVTTPFRLKFDYLQVCDGILSKFDPVFAELTAEFGTLPVIGVGHSCGSLLHTLITSLFPDQPRAANVLISFNNKPVTEAIPGFEEMVQPISKAVMGTPDTADGEDAAAGARQAIAIARGVFDSVLQGVGSSDAAPSIVKDEVVPAVQQSLELVDQIPELLSAIASGTSEFTPSPEATKTSVRRMYRANKTLLIQFDNDELDESPSIETALREAATMAHAEEPMIDMEVRLKTIGGTHVTPLTQNIIVEPPELSVPDPLNGVRQQVRENFLKTIDEVRTEITDFLSRV